MPNIKIKDFQSIQNAELELTGFTVITGKSNLGKSAVRRAFGTLLFNDWQQNYVRKSKDNSIIIWDDTDKHIIVKKGKDNSYTVNGKEYPRVGNDVPLEYRDFGWEILETQGGNKYKLQVAKQLEPLFMVGYTDVENTRILNSALKVDLYEEAAKLANTDAQREKQSLKIIKEDIINLQSDLKIEQEKFNNLDKNLKEIKEINEKYELGKRYIELINEKIKIEKDNQDTKIALYAISLLEKAKSNNRYLELARKVTLCQINKKLLRELTSKLQKIEIGKKYIELREEETQVENRKIDMKKIEVSSRKIEIGKKYIELKEEEINSRKREKALEDIDDIIFTLELSYKYLYKYNEKSQVELEIHKNTEKLENTKKQLTAIGVCPLCGGKGRLDDCSCN